MKHYTFSGRYLALRVWLGSIIFIVLGLFLGSCVPAFSPVQAIPTPSPFPTLIASAKSTFQVERGSISEVLHFDGRVIPIVQKDLFFKANNRVRKVYVKEGDLVKAGQLLADLEVVDSLEADLLSKNLDLRGAQARVDIAQNQLDLFKLNTVSSTVGYAQQLAVKNADLELAKIGLEQVKLNVQNSSRAITNASIISPIDGQLLSLRVEEGQTIEAYKPIAIVADVNNLEISSTPSSEVVAKISEGMSVLITDINDSTKIVQGSIRRMPYTSTIDTTAKQVRISLILPAAQVGFKLNQRIQVSIDLRSKDDVLLLPLQAIQTSEDQNFVLVKNGNLQQRVNVKIGIKTETQVEIMEGLSEGQIVIAP